MNKMENEKTYANIRLIGEKDELYESKRLKQMMYVQNEAFMLFKKKNADYGDAFAIYGPTGVIMRMQDKLQRYISINKTGINLVDTESLRDTLIDLHNYAAMAIMLLDEDANKNL